jgi:hypothetical protein
MVDTQDTRRSFEFAVDENTITKYFLGMPTSEQIRKADWHYSKVYNKALVEGIATESEMYSILRERNIVGPEYDKQREELQLRIAAKIHMMEAATEDLDKAKLALEVREAREQLYQMNQRVTGPLSNTCEQMANDAKTEYLTSAIVELENGDAVWKSHEEFLAEPNQRLIIRARYEILLWLEGLDQDFLENTPENKALREIAEARAQRSEAAKQLEAAKLSEAVVDLALEDATLPVTEGSVPVKKGRRKKSA